MGLIPGEVNLLYIEDDPPNANLMMEMLKRDKHTNFKVDHKDNLEDGIKELNSKECRYDIVLLDLMLSNSEGINTYKKVRGLCQDIPIVIISGYEDIAYECVKLGAQDYILKTDLTPGLISRSLKYAIERKRLENKHLLAENQFKDVINNTPLGIHMYELSDGELYFCGYNPAADKILNINHSPLLGIKIIDAFPDVGTIRDAYIHVIESGEPWTNNLVDYKDENVEGAFSVYAFKTSENKMATHFEDITDKVKMQNKLELSEERFKLLSDANFEGVVITQSGVILDINQRFADMLGSTIDDMIGKPVIDFVAPEDRALVLNNLNKKYEEPYEHMAKRKDGSFFLAEVHGRTLTNGLRLTAVRDMTRYKTAQDALERSERKYRELIEVSRAAIYEVDFISNKFVYVNDFVCEQTGYTKEEFLNMSPKDLLTEKSYKEFNDRLKKLSRGEYIPNEFEYAARTKSGDTVWVIITATYKEDENNNVIGARVIAVDITETKKARLEAERKEEIIFNNLEVKIQEWREEITLKSVATKVKLDEISLNINSMNNPEVH